MVFNKKRPKISAPINFVHKVHSGYDKVNHCFTDLPLQWMSIIEQQGLSDEYHRNEQTSRSQNDELYAGNCNADNCTRSHRLSEVQAKQQLSLNSSSGHTRNGLDEVSIRSSPFQVRHNTDVYTFHENNTKSLELRAPKNVSRIVDLKPTLCCAQPHRKVSSSIQERCVSPINNNYSENDNSVSSRNYSIGNLQRRLDNSLYVKAHVTDNDVNNSSLCRSPTGARLNNNNSSRCKAPHFVGDIPAVARRHLNGSTESNPLKIQRARVDDRVPSNYLNLSKKIHACSLAGADFRSLPRTYGASKTDGAERRYENTGSPALKQGYAFPSMNNFQTRRFSHEEFIGALRTITDAGSPCGRFENFVRIGEGSTSIVYTALDIVKNRTVAIKKMNVCKQQRKELLFNEISIMREFKHSCIVEMYAAYLLGSELWVIMEYLEGGTLTFIVTNHRMKEEQIATVCKSVLRALSYLHSNGIIHRDIKSDSILLSLNGQVKLSDFGFCAQVCDKIPQRRSLVGTPYWMSPEVIARQPYAFEADVWSFGIMVIEMVDGQPPYFSDAPLDAMSKIKKNPSPKPVSLRVSNQLQDFIQWALTKDPNQRCSAAKLLDHPFLLLSLDQDCLLPLLRTAQV